MPLYEFECLDCGERFEALVRGSHGPECPACRGHGLEQLVSLFGVTSESTRQTNLNSARRQNAKVRRDRAIADHEQHHKNLEH